MLLVMLFCRDVVTYMWLISGFMCHLRLAGPLWIVVSIAENGSLKDFLIAHYTSAASDYQNDKSSQSLSDVEKLRFAHGIAKGMSHLAKVKV